jgi:hypothetical protein
MSSTPETGLFHLAMKAGRNANIGDDPARFSASR